MRVFNKLRAEQISTISYPLVPEDVAPSGENQEARDKRLADNEARRKENPNAPDPDYVRAKDEPVAVDKTEKVVITTVHRESYEIPKADLLLSPLVANRKNPEGPIVGDWLVSDYDIQTDTVIRKIYDNWTFTRHFKASLTG
jgi:hypothetical protein